MYINVAQDERNLSIMGGSKACFDVLESFMLNIGQAADASGVSAKMIRHYEGVGLLPEAARTDSGYRQYAESDVRTLRFIRQSRDLGFSIDEIRELVGLWQNRKRPSRQVRALAEAHIQELDAKLQELHSMKAALEHLVQSCQGDERPDCPIIDALAQDEPVTTPGAIPSRSSRLKPGRRQRSS